MTATQSGQVESRYFGLDALRAAAMLLGVAWHAVQNSGPGGAFSFMDWLHSFRMPLFMLVSGFFCHMMLKKYGLKSYLLKRWWRIGAPLLIGLFTFVPLYQLYGRMGAMPPGRPPMAGGPQGPGGAPMPPGPGGPPMPGAFAAPGGPPGMSPPPAGMIPPPLLRFDEDKDGSLSEKEWNKARESMRGPSGRGPGGGPPGFGQNSSQLNRLLFGETGRFFSLGHLWFLWYLMVFVTAAPLVGGLTGWIGRNVPFSDRLSLWSAEHGVAPLILGLIALPCMMATPSFFGWGLGLATGIGGRFPDFLFQYQADWPFYSAFFLSGWWLYRERASLQTAPRIWLPEMVVGIALYAAARWVSIRYSSQTELEGYQLIRIFGYGLFSMAAAYTSFGLVGLFQRFCNRPNRVVRYFSDTALWIYLTHQDLLGPINYGLRPFHLSTTSQGFLATIATTAIGIALYELIVRPTPLVRIFGPGGGRKRQAAAKDVGAPLQEIPEVVTPAGMHRPSPEHANTP